MKYLIILLVLGLVWWAWRSRGLRDRRPQAQQRRAPGTPQADDTNPRSPQAMVRCARCSVHLPQADALVDTRGRWFCGPEHLRLSQS